MVENIQIIPDIFLRWVVSNCQNYIEDIFLSNVKVVPKIEILCS